MTKSNDEGSDCNCCQGLKCQTPAEIANRPGQNAILRRIGTHSQFKQSMISSLCTKKALSGLTTRDQDDFVIALLDSFAVMADVLTFYQERISNESYLRTAIHRESLFRLSRLVGRQLCPGVSASTYLAFSLDEIKGSPEQVLIEKGTKVQSVPGIGEQAQTFETVQEIQARPEYNSIKPLLTQPHPLSTAMKCLALKGLGTLLKKGDMLLISAAARTAADSLADQSQMELRRIESVQLDSKADLTIVKLVDLQIASYATGNGGQSIPDACNPPKYDRSGKPFADSSKYFGDLTEELVEDMVIGKTWRQEELMSLAAVQGWKTTDLKSLISELTGQREDLSLRGVFAFRQRSGIYGHNAPSWSVLTELLKNESSESEITGIPYKLKMASAPDKGEYEQPQYEYFDANPGVLTKSSIYGDNWDDLSLSSDFLNNGGNWIFLDNVYPGVIPGSILCLDNGVINCIYRVDKVKEISRSDYSLSSKVTALMLSHKKDLSSFKIKETTAFSQSEKLEIADVAIVETVPEGKRDSLTLDGFYPGLVADKVVILSGEPLMRPGIVESEPLIISEALLEDGFTRLIFKEAPISDYRRDTVRILANVALATHGESTREVLGSGDCSQPFQSFALHQSPLTFVSSDDPGGASSTLEVRVNGILWKEVQSLYGCGSKERVYACSTDDDGKTTVQFGDGQMGARLPTGQENIAASYRKGLGLGGILKAGQLTNLMTRPLGVKGVTNPLACNGGQDRETLEEARQNASLNILTLGKVVSLQDYEDFAKAFAGVSKALATWTWDGERRSIFLTVAGPGGSEIKAGSNLHKKLLAALRKAGDPLVPIRIETYKKAHFRLQISVKIDSVYRTEAVLSSLEKALRNGFSFEARKLGEEVTLDEVMALAQSIDGVVAVSIKALYPSQPYDNSDNNFFILIKKYDENSDLPVYKRLVARIPGEGSQFAQAAELLTLDQAPIGIEVML